MSDAPEQFDSLLRLMKLKRYEQPPPGYFENFSATVVAAIKSEPEPAFLDRLWDEAPWLKRFFTVLESNPLAAGGFATAVCALLIGGIVYSQYLDQAPQLVSINTDGTALRVSANSTPTTMASAKENALTTVGLGTNFYNTSPAANSSLSPALNPSFDPFKAAGATPKVTQVDFNP